MSERYDVITGRKREEKTYWTNIGSAWPRDGGGFSIELSALPIADHEGRVRMLIVKPTPRDGEPQRHPADASRQSISQRAAAPGPRAVMDDDIPFAPELRG